MFNPEAQRTTAKAIESNGSAIGRKVTFVATWSSALTECCPGSMSRTSSITIVRVIRLKSRSNV